MGKIFGDKLLLDIQHVHVNLPYDIGAFNVSITVTEDVKYKEVHERNTEITSLITIYCT